VAATAEPVRATGGLRVIPQYDFATAPTADILLIPGGFGTRPLLEDPSSTGSGEARRARDA
jgi:putative intracellular protease/amidase